MKKSCLNMKYFLCYTEDGSEGPYRCPVHWCINHVLLMLPHVLTGDSRIHSRVNPTYNLPPEMTLPGYEVQLICCKTSDIMWLQFHLSFRKPPSCQILPDSHILIPTAFELLITKCQILQAQEIRFSEGGLCVRCWWLHRWLEINPVQ